MKKLLPAFALILSVACLANPIMRGPAKRAPLQGKVKIVRSSAYGGLNEYQARTWLFNKEYYTVDSFSSTGLKLSTQWIVRGEVSGGVLYKYDTSGKKTEERTYSTDMPGTELSVFTYDTSGKLAEETIYTVNAGRTISTRYIYVAGRLLSKEMVGRETTNYFYNDKGQVVKEDLYYHNHDRPTTTKYTYDNNGRIMSEMILYGADHQKSIYYSYDKHNNEVLAEEYANGGILIRRFETEYVYDSQGNWIRCIEDMPGDRDEGSVAKQVYIREIEYYY